MEWSVGASVCAPKHEGAKKQIASERYEPGWQSNEDSRRKEENWSTGWDTYERYVEGTEVQAGVCVCILNPLA